MKACCVVCGKVYEKLTPTKTCGSKCAREHRDEYRREFNAKRRKYAVSIGKCAVCGKEFEKQSPRHKNCGPVCSEQSSREGIRKWKMTQRQLRPKYSYNCAVCGKDFQAGHPQRRTCSPECSKEHTRTLSCTYKSPPGGHRIDCAICGKEFKHGNPLVKGCSVECRTEMARQRIQEKRSAAKQPKHCAVCGGAFEPTTSRKTCGEECWKILAREAGLARGRKYRAANPERCRKYSREYQQKWRLANPELARKRSRERSRRLREIDPESGREYRRQWRLKKIAANPEKARADWRDHYRSLQSARFFSQLQTVKEQLQAHVKRIADHDHRG